jgi:ankyrin repeat protein
VIYVTAVPEIEARENSGLTALAWATRMGETATVKVLLEHGSSPMERDHSEFTPQLQAATN